MDIHLACALYTDTTAADFFASIRDRGRQICTHTIGRKNLPIVCHQRVELEEHYSCHCAVFYEMRGSYHCLFNQGVDPIHKVMEYVD